MIRLETTWWHDPESIVAYHVFHDDKWIGNIEIVDGVVLVGQTDSTTAPAPE